MGINKNSLRFLLLAKKRGVNFSRTAMIGRQTLNMPLSDFTQVMSVEFGCKEPPHVWQDMHKARYAEGILRYLGATIIDSFDYSDYESATHLHDFNNPISDRHKGRYTLVIDGGSLEHVFNYPTALRSCMEMPEVGGHFISLTPANNYFGHGFYQISPEVFYRSLVPNNGYRIEALYMFDDNYTRAWSTVMDPDKAKRRVTLVNHLPVLLVVLSTRISNVPIFQQPPQQSAYVFAWDGESAEISKSQRFGSLRKLFRTSWGSRIAHWAKRVLPRPRNKSHFNAVDIIDLLKE